MSIKMVAIGNNKNGRDGKKEKLVSKIKKEEENKINIQFK